MKIKSTLLASGQFFFPMEKLQRKGGKIISDTFFYLAQVKWDLGSEGTDDPKLKRKEKNIPWKTLKPTELINGKAMSWYRQGKPSHNKNEEN